MTTSYRTKLFRSVLDCGCNLSLGDFSEEADFEDVERWLRERGYVPIRRSGLDVDEVPTRQPASSA